MLRFDGLYEVFVIDAKVRFIKNKTVKGKKTKKGITIIEEKMIVIPFFVFFLDELSFGIDDENFIRPSGRAKPCEPSVKFMIFGPF